MNNTRVHVTARIDSQLWQRIESHQPAHLNRSQWLNLLLEAQMDFVERSKARKFSDQAEPSHIARSAPESSSVGAQSLPEDSQTWDDYQIVPE